MFFGMHDQELLSTECLFLANRVFLLVVMCTAASVRGPSSHACTRIISDNFPCWGRAPEPEQERGPVVLCG